MVVSRRATLPTVVGSGHDDGHRRSAPRGGAARRAARARLRDGCSTRCWRSCSIRRSTSAAPSAGSSCSPTPEGKLEFKLGAGPRPRHAAGPQLRDEPQDSGGGVRHRASRASSPTCSTAISRTSTWAPSRSASATCCACRCASCAISTRARPPERRAAIGVLYLDSREKGSLLVELHARRARDAGDRGGGRDRERAALPRDAREGAARAGDEDRRRDPAGAAAAGSRTARRHFEAAATTPALPVDRRRLLRLSRARRRHASASRSATWPARDRRRRC